jgi:hypothetical protein
MTMKFIRIEAGTVAAAGPLCLSLSTPWRGDNGVVVFDVGHEDIEKSILVEKEPKKRKKSNLLESELGWRKRSIHLNKTTQGAK